MKKISLRYRCKFNKNFICIIIIMFLITGIGFAYIQSTFSINGAVNIKNGSWDVHFTNIRNINGSNLTDINSRLKEKKDLIELTKIEEPEIVISDDLKTIITPILFESKLDFIEFEVDVVNEGKYDAMIADLDFVRIPNDLVDFIKLDVTYQNGSVIQNNDLLACGENKTLKIKLSFKDNIGDKEIPTGEYKIEYEIPYIQATSDAIDRS